MTKYTGLIALDIDGTVTEGAQPLPKAVKASLEHYASKGWAIAFISGRTYPSSEPVLKQLDCEYFLAVYNGALLMRMPSQELLTSKLVGRQCLLLTEAVCEREPTGLVVHSGPLAGNRIFYLPHTFTKDLSSHLHRRCVEYREVWCALRSWDELPCEEFVSMKAFGAISALERLAKSLEEEKVPLHTPVIKDPFDRSFGVLQMTDGAVMKGQALRDLKARLGIEGPTIAAGDDLNDVSLLAAAEIGIAMRGAPKEVMEHAKVLAPSVEEVGIVQGLNDAYKMLELL